MLSTKNQLTPEDTKALLSILKQRFLDNMHRHPGVVWKDIEVKLSSDNVHSRSGKLWSLNQMEITGGEPDVVMLDMANRKNDSCDYLFCDCVAESPLKRRSLCYDGEALAQRKANKPISSAIVMAMEMGVEIMDEHQYRALQQLEKFDMKTSSWIKTPDSIRQLGGALFCDRRYDQVFVYHNGAESYYAARGFRAVLCL